MEGEGTPLTGSKCSQMILHAGTQGDTYDDTSALCLIQLRVDRQVVSRQ